MDLQVELLLSRSEFLSDKFERCSETCYIDEAIVIDRKALDICTPGQPNRPACLVALSWHIWTRYQQLGGMENINEAIVLGREALALCPPEHTFRSLSLSNLAVYIYGRYQQLGGVDDLDEAIRLNREALVLRPLGHPDRPSSLSNLAVYLLFRYKELGGAEDLDEAIHLDRAALALRPPGHLSRSLSLNSLANCLWTRYNILGEVDDLDEAIRLDRDALVLHPPGHPNRSASLNNLAVRLSTRYNNLGGVADLNEAIRLDRDALTLRPPGHPDRSMSLHNLAVRLWTRYNNLGGVDDLHDVIRFDRESLALCPPGHPDRSSSLNNLAIHLWTRYNKFGGMDDLHEAIQFDRDALAVRPPGHPSRSVTLNNLAICLLARYNELGGAEDLNEAIQFNREALVLRPPGHPDRPASLQNLAADLSSRYKQFHEAEDREEIFRVYSELSHGTLVSSYSLSAAKAWVNAAEHFHHPTTRLAYETTLQLLAHHFAVLPSLPQHLAVYKDLSSSLAVNAFSACLRSQSLTTAVELLEQGRGVFWSQLARLRFPLDDIITSGPAGKTLADEFTHLTSLIRIALNDSPDDDKHDRVWHLNLKLQNVVSNIRELPGRSHFLLPLPFSDLQHAASGGPVIIVNASNYSCDALVVFADRDPVHIPLPVTKYDVWGMSSKLGELTARAKRSIVTKDIGGILRELWDRVVSPITEFLRTACPPQSRIWWCPTAEFSLLPFHAAGPYRNGQFNFADLYVSSYTPTLSALIRARRHHPSSLAMGQCHLLGVGQAKTIGEEELLSVSIELMNVGKQVDGHAAFTSVEGEESCISRITEELMKNQWVHLACHGIPNRTQPFESAFALHDGDFTIQHIVRCDLKDPEFAYLSACHTTVGSEESLDEVIHLASAMQFAGFRSVIGTMWAVDDAQTVKITSEFYTHMIDESGRLDYTRAAYALWKTTRTVDVPFDQRILYVHIGA